MPPKKSVVQAAPPPVAEDLSRDVLLCVSVPSATINLVRAAHAAAAGLHGRPLRCKHPVCSHEAPALRPPLVRDLCWLQLFHTVSWGRV